jgi:hypothetical protein
MTLALLLGGLDAGRWDLWALAFLGTGLAILTLIGGRLVFTRAPRAAEVKPAEEGPTLDPFVFGSTSEKRSAARRKGGIIEVLLSDEQAKAEPWSGYVVDRSLGGLCLLVKKWTQPGTIVTMRPVEAPPGVPWIEAKVRSCRQASDGWLLGCQFVRIPPTALLLMFG